MSATPEERDAKQRSAAIDRQLRSDLKEYENTIKILLLGRLCLNCFFSFSLGDEGQLFIVLRDVDVIGTEAHSEL